MIAKTLNHHHIVRIKIKKKILTAEHYHYDEMCLNMNHAQETFSFVIVVHSEFFLKL